MAQSCARRVSDQTLWKTLLREYSDTGFLDRRLMSRAFLSLLKRHLNNSLNYMFEFGVDPEIV